MYTCEEPQAMFGEEKAKPHSPKKVSRGHITYHTTAFRDTPVGMEIVVLYRLYSFQSQ